MKISNIQMLNGLRKLVATILLMSLSLLNFKAFSQGEALFKSKCATCHQPHKNGTGPKLFQVRDKWSAGGAKEGSIYQWVNNWQTAAASDSYAAEVSKWSPTAMSAFPDLKKEDIDAILDWVDAQPDPATAATTGGPTDGSTVDVAAETEEEGSIAWIWIVMGVIFVVIIMAVGGVRRQLTIATSDNPESQEKLTYGEELRSWAWKNKVYVGVATLVVVISLIVGFLQSLSRIGVVEGYQPSQPIAFPHDRHAGINGIDCKYCHNSVTKSKHAGIPSVNVCMNCHKQINGEGKPFAGEIKKIYKAAGWDPSGAGKYTGKETPIVWNKVHVLPDHVYFNHSQHVVVGGIDCKQCHGDMTTMNETAKVQPVEELNKIEGNIKLTKPTLTMGWCIECHGAKEVAIGNGKSGYYDEIHRRLKKDKALYRKYLKDGKITVNELGGWECAKCHY
jgi:mono/diheme cytochrome c family protein